jgi:hypothetical protein
MLKDGAIGCCGGFIAGAPGLRSQRSSQRYDSDQRRCGKCESTSDESVYHQITCPFFSFAIVLK